METVRAVDCDIFDRMTRRHRTDYLTMGQLPTVKSMSNVRIVGDGVCDIDDMYYTASLSSSTDDVGSVSFSLDAAVELDSSVSSATDRTIHSGHFMLSHVHDDEDSNIRDMAGLVVKDDVIDDDSDSDIGTRCAPLTCTVVGSQTVSLPCEINQPAISVAPVATSTATATALPIDTTLTRLFECMTLAYSGKLRTPKWKNFRKIKVGSKDKIRLNNLIWREWHMQYKQGRPPVGCQFVTRIPETSTKNSVEMNDMKKYWREQLNKVVHEYSNWKPVLCHKLGEFIDNSWAHTLSSGQMMPWSAEDDDLMNSEDFLMDLSDTLFSSLNPSNSTHTPADIFQLTADIMQPDLIPLVPNQPMLEDFMDTIEETCFRSGAKFTTTWMANASSSQTTVVPKRKSKLEELLSTEHDESGNNEMKPACGHVTFVLEPTENLYNDVSSTSQSNLAAAGQQLFINQFKPVVDSQPLLMEIPSNCQIPPSLVVGLSTDAQQPQQLVMGVSADTIGRQSLLMQLTSACQQPGGSGSFIVGPQPVMMGVGSDLVLTIMDPQCKLPDECRQTTALSFGSSEEILAMLHNQSLHDNATLSQQLSPKPDQLHLTTKTAAASTLKQTVFSTPPNQQTTVLRQPEALPSAVQQLPSQFAMRQQPPPVLHLPSRELRVQSSDSLLPTCSLTLQPATPSAVCALQPSVQQEIPNSPLVTAKKTTECHPTAYNDDLLQQLLLMLCNDQTQALPSIAESNPLQQPLQTTSFTLPQARSSTLSDASPAVVDLQPMQSARASTIMQKLEQVDTKQPVPVHSLENFSKIMQETGSRRASTGSLQAKTSAFKAPQTSITSVTKRMLLPRPSALSGSVSPLQPSTSQQPQPNYAVLGGAVRSDSSVPLSGTLQIDRSRTGSDTVLQTRRVMSNILTRAGSSGTGLSNRETSKRSAHRRNSFLEQLLTQDSSTDNNVTWFAGEATTGRTRHKSDHSANASSGVTSDPFVSNCAEQREIPVMVAEEESCGVEHTGIKLATETLPDPRAIAVFQPINPLTLPSSPAAASVGRRNPSLTSKSSSSPMTKAKSSLTRIPKMQNLESVSDSSTAMETGNESYHTGCCMLASPQEAACAMSSSTLRSPSSDRTDLQFSLAGLRVRPPSGDNVIITQTQQVHLTHDKHSSSLSQTLCDSVDVTRQERHENRRVSHITAEQRRRGNIKSGFDVLNQLIPCLSQTTNVKISKATTLLKAAEMCRRLKHERSQMLKEAERLRSEISSCEAAINDCQSKLPASGVVSTSVLHQQRHSSQLSRQRIEKYIASRALVNWKFWIFAEIIIRSLFESFDNSVSNSKRENLNQTLLDWLQDHCSLKALRPVVMTSVRQLSMTTSILTDPSAVPSQIINLARQQASVVKR